MGRLFGAVLSVALGLGAIPLMVESHFGGSPMGFLGLVGALLMVGALLGYLFTRLGRGSMRRIVGMSFLYAAPGVLLVNELGGPAIMLPVIPLLFVSTLVGGRHALKKRLPGP